MISLCVPMQPMKLVTGEEQHLSIRFDPAYKDDLNSRVAEEVLFIKFLEHPHEEQVTLRGEVHFPNLHFQTMYLDFGCILNDTEDMRYIEITNYSPLLVKYRWSFLTDDHGNQIRYFHHWPWSTPPSHFEVCSFVLTKAVFLGLDK